ncbi:LOW QUALITY PROTEIN: Glutaredoxin [Dillenia turbinata]|uniref:Glutaredoxin n=1 Tax=Dillenia turbinata TaxID=194707 RepID=A0AAN8V6J6_9MAGN
MKGHGRRSSTKNLILFLVMGVIFASTGESLASSTSPSAFIHNVIYSNKIADVLLYMVGRRTVPQVFVNGEHIGGSDDLRTAVQECHLWKLLKRSLMTSWWFEAVVMAARGVFCGVMTEFEFGIHTPTTHKATKTTEVIVDVNDEDDRLLLLI